jgi:uncharacterized protein YqgV (UPF0045/DUF77 family)
MPRQKGNQKAQELRALLTKIEQGDFDVAPQAEKLAKELGLKREWERVRYGIKVHQIEPDDLSMAVAEVSRILTRLDVKAKNQ